MTNLLITSEAESAENIASAPAELDQEARTKHLSRRGLLLRRFLRNKTAVLGLFMYVLLILLAIFGPGRLTEWNYTELDQTAFLQGPTWSHKLGTTQSGRDVLAMSLQGLRVSMLISLVVGVGATTIAAIVGSFAAYFGGWFERISLWSIDLLLVLPGFLIIALFMRNINSNLATLAGVLADGPELDAVGADRPQSDDVGARPGVRHGCEVHGRSGTEDHRPPHPSQCRFVAHHRRHLGDRRRRHRRDEPVVLRFRDPVS